MSGAAADSHPEETILHASCVSLAGRSLLLTGPSGSGKSGLALQLLALGAGLVADDQVIVRRTGRALLATSPDAIRGLIEARGVGLLRAEPVASARLVAAVDLGQAETERLPPLRETLILGVRLPVFRKVDAAHFPAALLQFLKTGFLTDAKHD